LSIGSIPSPLTPNPCLRDEYLDLTPGPPPLTPLCVGRKLGQYTILEEIGQGGMGAVFKANDAALDRLVALKVLTVSPIDDPRQAERFMREARALARLNHPNLLHVHNVGQEADCHYFAMELLEGETLSDAVELRQRIPSDELIPIIGQILSALHYIHQQGIIHRDIKSSNIMLCRRRAVLMDFGLVKDANAAALTSAGAVLGTPEFMAPEAARGETAGPPTDIYGIGVVLYEALSGALPFHGRSATSIIRQHAEDPPPPLKIGNELAPALAEIVYKCLKKAPAERYPTCAELARDLVKLQSTPELAALAESCDPTALTAEMLVPVAPPKVLSNASLQATAIDVARRSPLTSAAETLDAMEEVDGSRAETLIAPPRARSKNTWLWLCAGFFGVISLALAISILNGQKPIPPITPIVPTESTRTQTTVWQRHSDGNSEEIHWIEFNCSDPDPSKWYHVIERKDADNKWVRERVSHKDFMAAGGSLQFEAPEKTTKPADK